MRAQTPGRAVTPSTRSHGRRDVGLSALAPAAPEPGHVEAIVQSHERCVALGVSRIEHPDHAPIARPDFMIAVERNRRLHDHAALSPLALDRCRSFFGVDFRQIAERDPVTVCGRHEHAPECRLIRAVDFVDA